MFALASIAACTASSREVHLTVRSGFAIDPASTDPLGIVDRYHLAFFRRHPSTLHWVEVGSQYFVLPGARNDVVGAALDGGTLEAGDGTHILRPSPETDPDAPIMVVVQGGTEVGGNHASFRPRGLPVVAQFAFPMGSGQLTLTLEPDCETIDPYALGARSPYFTCVVRNENDSQCPVFESICVTFQSDGTARRTPCAEDPFAPRSTGDAGVDAGANLPSCPALDGSGMPVVARSIALDAPCEEPVTCGLYGLWSRCIDRSPCEHRALGAPCCVAHFDEGACPPLAPVRACDGANACSADRHVCSDCGLDGLSCCGAAHSCDTGFTCNPTSLTCGCGGMGEPCCQNSTCEGSSLRCVDNRCAECGTPGHPCCVSGCFSTLLQPVGCRTATGNPLDGTCEPCGIDGLRCCPDGTCVADTFCNMTTTPHTCRSCGGDGQPCCPGMRCRDPLHCSNTTERCIH